jgi:hypothetical protein
MVLKQYILTNYSVRQILLSGTLPEAHYRFWISYLTSHVAGINGELTKISFQMMNRHIFCYGWTLRE